MIRTSGGWVHERDLEKTIPGRRDPAELVERCNAYLTTGWQEPRRGDTSPTRQLAQKARAELAAAQLRQSAKSQLDEANAAISRLLAFVPKRAAEIPAGRLEELLHEVTRVTYEFFRNPARVTITSDHEDAPETEACHRIRVTPVLGADADIAEAISAAARVHKTVALFLSPEELRAVRLIVEPEFEHDGSTGQSRAS